MAMVFTALVTLFVFISGMLVFYAYLQTSWVNGLDEESRRNLETLMESGEIHPDALTTLVASFSSSWTASYGGTEAYFFIIFALSAMVCAIVIGLLIAPWISRPIEAVTKAATKVAQGSLGFQLSQQDRASLEAHDLTQTFNAMTRSIEQAERESSASAAAIAHELRTPLTILRGRLQGLADNAFEPSVELIEALIGQVDTLSRITDDLAALSLLSAGHYQPETDLIDLAKEVRSVLIGFRSNLEAAEMRLDERLQSVEIEAEPARIRQALSALLENATRYAASGKYVCIETFAQGDLACLRVTDHGPGIDKDDLESIFDRWWRVDQSRTRDAGGSGLGLSVVRAIVQSHGGSVIASDNREHGGQGVTFTIRLPQASAR